MNAQQKQVMDSFVRVRSFLDATPTDGSLTYTSAREMLDDVVQRLRQYAADQRLGLEQSRAEVRRQQDQAAVLFDRYIRPLVTIARAQVEPGSDVGLPEALRMPKRNLGPTKLLAACDSLIAAARPFEALFTAHGLPAGFLDRFTAARNQLERLMSGRATQVVTHVAAGAGIRRQLVRGRLAVERLDAIVRAEFREDVVKLSAWRVAKRVHLAPGGRGIEGDEVPASESVAPSAPVAAPVVAATPRAA